MNVGASSSKSKKGVKWVDKPKSVITRIGNAITNQNQSPVTGTKHIEYEDAGRRAGDSYRSVEQHRKDVFSEAIIQRTGSSLGKETYKQIVSRYPDTSDPQLDAAILHPDTNAEWARSTYSGPVARSSGASHNHAPRRPSQKPESSNR